MGDDSSSRDHGFESRRRILDGHFSHWFVVKFVLFVWKRSKINEKEAGVGPFKKKNCTIIYSIVSCVKGFCSIDPWSAGSMAAMYLARMYWIQLGALVRSKSAWSFWVRVWKTGRHPANSMTDKIWNVLRMVNIVRKLFAKIWFRWSQKNLVTF